jgi:hypothetical protein
MVRPVSGPFNIEIMTTKVNGWVWCEDDVLLFSEYEPFEDTDDYGEVFWTTTENVPFEIPPELCPYGDLDKPKKVKLTLEVIE